VYYKIFWLEIVIKSAGSDARDYFLVRYGNKTCGFFSIRPIAILADKN
jgi:hypothetical protein